jgi:hypothetical protein
MPEQDVVLSDSAPLVFDSIPPIGPFANRSPAEVQEVLRQNRLMLLRHKRNQLLAECDWTQSEDVPVEVRDSWKPYRQALRDITQHYSDLSEAVFPEKPE